jgi:hypothetical protein
MINADLFVAYLAEHYLPAITFCLGSIFVGYIAYISSRQNRAADAATRFRESFTGILLNLEHNASLPSAQIANIDHNQILSAIQQFRCFVPWYRLCSFNKSACEYQRACEIAREYGDIFAQFASEQDEYAQAKRSKLHSTVEALLSYAKET